MRRSQKVAVAFLLFLAGVPAACTPPGAGIGAPSPADPLRGLDAYIEQAMTDWGVAGLAIAVVKDDSVVFADGFGVREVGRPEPVDENTLFAIGSNTKLFTAVAAGIMVDEEKMSWDDPATKHLPGFQLYDPYVSREITLRDLLSHNSGLGRRGDLLWYGTDYDRDEVLRRIRLLEPSSSFRSEFGYQNIMFLAAGQAIAAAAGRSWDDVIDARIFTPLGMRRSNTSVLDLAGDANVATAHMYVDGAPVPVPWRNIDNIAPAGSINSSALEMAQWLRTLLAEGSYEGEVIVEPETLAEITSAQTLVSFSPDTLFPSTHFGAYGLGIGMRDYRGKKMLTHTGGIDGMLSLVGLIPEEELGVVVLTNTQGHNSIYAALMYRVFDAYLNAPPRDWSAILLAQSEAGAARARAAEEAIEAARVSGTRPSLPLERYVGTYEHEMYGDASISMEAGGLVLQFGPAFTGDLEHWHYDTFRVTWRDPLGDTEFVTFALDARGRIAEIDVQGMATFERVQDEPDELPTGR